MTYRKLDCECKHTHEDHSTTDDQVCAVAQCPCTAYDPAGHNPELYNILCPQCRKVRLEKADARTYECPVCHYIMFEKQVEAALG
jgi:hypothetical protein